MPNMLFSIYKMMPCRTIDLVFFVVLHRLFDNDLFSAAEWKAVDFLQDTVVLGKIVDVGIENIQRKDSIFWEMVFHTCKDFL